MEHNNNQNIEMPDYWEIHDLGGTVGKRVAHLEGAYDAVMENALEYLISDKRPDAESRAQQIVQLIGELENFNKGIASKKPSLTKFGKDITDTLIWALENEKYDFKGETVYPDAADYLERQVNSGTNLAILSDSSPAFIDFYLGSKIGDRKINDLIARKFLGSHFPDKKSPQTFIGICEIIADEESGVVKRFVDDDEGVCSAAIETARKYGLGYEVILMDRPGRYRKDCDKMKETESKGITVVASYKDIMQPICT